MEKQDFIKNPSKEQLKADLELVGIIINTQSQNKEIVVENGKVYENIGQGKRIELGTLTDIAALTQELFGDEVPDGVEYMKLGDVTFMTYYGHLIACEDGSQLKDSWAVDFFAIRLCWRMALMRRMALLNSLSMMKIGMV